MWLHYKRHGGQEVEKNQPETELFYSGTSNNRDTYYEGIGFAIKRKYADSIMKFEAIDESLCYLRLKGRFKNISVIYMYAPSEESDDETKELFYTRLDTLFQSVPNYQYKLVIGDASAKEGQEDR